MASVALDGWQYRLSRDESPGDLAIGPLWLSVGSGLPVIRVTDSAGLSVGILLGFPIDLARQYLISDAWQAPVQSDVDPDAFSRDMLRGLGGRFLWIQTVGGTHRIYPDCSGQVPCVYDRVAGTAGSTAYALLDEGEYDRRFDGASFNRLGIDGEGWFPAGLTAHHGINRLLPNHYLDLHIWEVRRFWPLADLTVTDDPAATVNKIIDIVRCQFEALLGGPKRLALALTAGHETRMLLACARPYLKDIDFVTVSGGDRHEVDTVLARHIARDLGLNHITLPRIMATKEQRERFIFHGGHCNADTNSWFHPSVWPIAKTHNFVGGLGGEVARAFLWSKKSQVNTKLTASILIGRLGLPETEQLITSFNSWLNEMPPCEVGQALDLVYLEHRMGPWYGAQFCCDPTLVRLAPLLTFDVIELMLRLPQDWKLTDRLGHAIIEKLWPELERYPYNSLGRWKDMMVKVQRVVADPRIVLKKLRKLRS